MKISKKLLSVVLSLIMVFSAVAVCSVTASADVAFPEYDATKTSLVIGTPQAKTAGQTVTVPVSIENNTGLWAVNIQLAYDTTNLSIASTGAVTAGDVLKGFCDYSVSDGVITVYIEQAGNEFVNTTTNGVVFNVVFTVANHTVGAIYPIDFTFKDRYSVIEAQSGAEIDGLTFKNGGVECIQNKITPAQVTGLKAGDFVHTLGDAHLYLNHIEQAKLQLTREPYALPKMRINPNVKNIFDFKFDDFSLEEYIAHPHIKAEVSV